MSQTVVVGGGEEGSFFGNQIFDFGANTFSIRSAYLYCGIFSCGNNPVSLSLSSLDLDEPISGVVLSTSLSGVTYTYTATSVTFSWLEQEISPTTYLSATFLTDVVTAVPEPTSLMLFGAGMIGLSAVCRERRKVSA